MMHTRWLAVGLAAALFAPSPLALAQTPALDLPQLESRFRAGPPETRRLTGPLFWLHGDESQERLEAYVAKVAEGGNGCFTAESRPHQDWLGDGWFRDLGICLAAAKKHDLRMWIFDEKWWPSGEVGGKVPPRYGCKRLVATAATVVGPAHLAEHGYGGPQFVAALAGRETAAGIDGTSLVDLAGAIRDDRLEWDVPEGAWKVMRFTWSPVGGRVLVDGASKDCVDWYVRTVYEPHYQRFQSDFGRSIAGFFYDEPETPGDWGTEVLPMLQERKVDWKRALVAWKFVLAGEEQAAARYQYQDALAEAWGRTFYGRLSRWCRERGVQSIGHFLEHRNEYLHPGLCAGNMVQLQKYSDMGGIDAVFRQFEIGQRVTQDHPVWQTPKLGSSITHAYGKPDDVTMVEIFGARGQDLTYPEMKWWTDHMHVSGVNFLIPHSFNPRAPRDTDCPPYFYNGGFEPRWPLYRVFADYTSRLSLMLTGGRHVCPVALLYLGSSFHAGKAVTPEAMSEALQDALFDCDWLPYEVFEQDAALAGREIRLREEVYRVLVVPPVEVLPYATLEKVKAFFDRGGIVVGHGFLPTKSATLGKTSADITRLREALWGEARPGLAAARTNAAGGRSYLLPEAPSPEDLQRVLTGDAGIHPTLEVLEGRTAGWLHVLHRVRAGSDVFFIANQDHRGEARRFRFRITAGGHPECWDAMRNEITTVPGQRTGRQVELALTLEPSESVLLVFHEEERVLPARLEAGLGPPRASLPVVREPAPPEPAPMLDTGPDPARRLEGCSWVWYPEGAPSVSAPPGPRWFRRTLTIPADRRIAKATFFGSADNAFVLYVNGHDAGHGDDGDRGWAHPVELDVAAHLQPGVNQLAIVATNASDQPNPAGLIGRLVVEVDAGEPISVATDGTWKAANAEHPGWRDAGFDDGRWPDALAAAPFGAGPWGRLGSSCTWSPVTADPFVGHVEVPAAALAAPVRVYLEMDAIEPEAAARVTVNGQDAGGFIGRPLRLEVTRFVQSGANAVRIEPFAPQGLRLVIRE